MSRPRLFAMPLVVALTGISLAACSGTPSDLDADDPPPPPVAECPEPREVTANIADHTTWENWVAAPSCFDYVVRTNVGTNDYDLVIEAGVVVGFDAGMGLRIRSDGAILAEGTQSNPIVLTGTTPQRGFWTGLSLEFNRHQRNVLTWVTVEHTAGHNISGTEAAGLTVARQGFARVENSTFRNSSGYGVSLSLDGRLTGSGNVFTENALGPAWGYAAAIASLSGSTLDGNDVDEVVVFPTSIGEDANWPRAIYRIVQSGPQTFAVTDGVLRLAAGTELRFEADQAMLVHYPGGFSALGTEQAPVVITGTSATRGHWGGIGFIGSDHSENRFEHTVVEYGGGQTIGEASETANIVLTRGASGQHSRVVISNSVLRESSEYGLWARMGSALPSFEGNTLTANSLGAAYVHAPVVNDLLTSNSFTGNDTDELVVETGSSLGITEDAIWRDLGIPYFLRYKVGPATSVVASLTIEPGVEMLIEPGLGISMQDGGSMTAVGTEQNRIIMRPKTDPWQGLDFLDADGTFDFVDIIGGGSDKWGTTSGAANVTIRAGQESSLVTFGPDASIQGAEFAHSFSVGPAYAEPCIGPVVVRPGDSADAHCR